MDFYQQQRSIQRLGPTCSSSLALLRAALSLWWLGWQRRYCSITRLKGMNFVVLHGNSVFSMESINEQKKPLTCVLWCSMSKLRFSSSPSKKSGAIIAITAIIDGEESLILQEPEKYSPLGCLCLVCGVSPLLGVLLAPCEPLLQLPNSD